MQKWDDLTEIEALGEEEEEDWPPPEDGNAESGGLSSVPFLQAVVCVLALLGILILRQTGHPAYEEIRAAYQREAAQEIQLPPLPYWEGGGTPTPAPSPSPPPQATGTPAVLPGLEVQRL